MISVDSVDAFVLHTRHYRDTSLIVELFTELHGRVSVIATGARNSSKYRMSFLQPFVPLKVSYRGKLELHRLLSAESCEPPYYLQGKALFSAFYLNELLLRVLPKQDPHGQLFRCYQQTVIKLIDKTETEILLRQFEKQLLTDLGYALPLTVSFHNECYYQFETPGSFVQLSEKYAVNNRSVFLGAYLNAMAQDDYANKNVLRAAKQLMRLALRPLLGDKPLKSRELFMFNEEKL